MKKGLTSGLVLLILGSVCGLILGIVNFYTAPIIAERELKEKLAALEQFYPNITEVYNVVEITLEGNIETIYVLTNKTDEFDKAAVYIVHSMGYKSDVVMMIAVNKDLKVDGYAVLGDGGTSGLGITLSEEDFGMHDAFVTDTAGSFDAISGATISSDAVQNCFDLVAARAATDLGGD